MMSLNQPEPTRDLPRPIQVSSEPNLIPQLRLMQLVGINFLEEWFPLAKEWSNALRGIWGGIAKNSSVLEIGCGLVGRTAFPLRYILSDGSYDGFEIFRKKIEFWKQPFPQTYPNFCFIWPDVHNRYFNSQGQR